ncbi:DinB family protein [Pseudogracilibacillus sp. SE30717A]|uniref:DinB family protein n=1 Tax=Pseudogracilibacillus sp. SE30717A TaxID=3098293 RepID=UPI00300E522A
MKKRHEILFNQLHTYRNELLNELNGINEEKANIIPKGFNNNIRWNLGHVYLDQFLWIQELTKKTIDIPNIFHTSFGFRTSPNDFVTETPSTADLKERLKSQPTYIQNEYGHRLEEEFPPIDMGIRTIEQVLMRTVFHEGMHMQAIIDIKKFL